MEVDSDSEMDSRASKRLKNVSETFMGVNIMNLKKELEEDERSYREYIEKDKLEREELYKQDREKEEFYEKMIDLYTIDQYYTVNPQKPIKPLEFLPEKKSYKADLENLFSVIDSIDEDEMKPFNTQEFKKFMKDRKRFPYHEYKKEIVKELNKSFFMMTGNIHTIKSTPYAATKNYCPEIKNLTKPTTEIIKISLTEFKNMLAPYKVYEKYTDQTTEQEKTRTHEVRKTWMDSTEKREISEFCFIPSLKPGFVKTVENATFFNEWRGLPFLQPTNIDYSEREMKQLKLFLLHMFEIICDKCPKKYFYLTFWLAYKLKYPEVRPETAIALVGEKGAGKSVFLEIIQQLFGNDQAIYFQNPKQLLAKFGGPLFKKAVIVMADEICFTEKEDVERLKTLITGSERNHEEKGKNMTRQVENFLAILFSTNDIKALGPEIIQRRMFVLNVSDRYAYNSKEPRKNDYMKCLQMLKEENNRDQAPKFLSLLTRYFLCLTATKEFQQFQPRLVPNNDDTFQYFISNISGFDQWWFEKIIENNGQWIIDKDTRRTNIPNLYLDYRTASKNANQDCGSQHLFTEKVKKYMIGHLSALDLLGDFNLPPKFTLLQIFKQQNGFIDEEASTTENKKDQQVDQEYSHLSEKERLEIKLHDYLINVDK